MLGHKADHQVHCYLHIVNTRPVATRRSPMPIRRGIARIFWRLSRWTYVPESPRYEGSRIVIGAPHTSNWDFVFMLCIAWSEGLRLRWLGKKSLFAGWRRPIMRGLGGIPVDRANPAGLVDTLVSEMRADPDLVLVVTPEGTRSSGTTWRSGFYRIALAAQVPVTLGYVDRPSRTCGLGETLRLTADVSADMDRIRAFYADKSGLRPELRTEPRLSDEAGGSATTTDPDKR